MSKVVIYKPDYPTKSIVDALALGAKPVIEFDEKGASLLLESPFVDGGEVILVTVEG